MGDETQAEYINSMLRGRISLNSGVHVAGVTGQWSLPPDRTLTDRQQHNPWDVWIEEGTDTTVTLAEVLPGSPDREINTLSTDDSDASARAVLETGPLGIYRSGTTVTNSAGVWVQDLPSGYVEVGHTQEGTTDALTWRITSADDLQFRIRNQERDEVTLSRASGDFDVGVKESVGPGEVIGLNPVDGTRYGVTWDKGRGHVYGVVIGWYGPSSVMGYITGFGEYQGRWSYHTWPVFLYKPTDGPAIQRPNAPNRVEVNNDGTAAENNVLVGGRQFMARGEFEDVPEPNHTYAFNQSLPNDGTGSGAEDWYVIGVVKRKAGQLSTAVGVEEIAVEPSNEAVAVKTRVVDEQYLSGTSYSNAKGVHGEESSLEYDIAEDTPDRVTLDEFTDPDDSITKPEGVAFGGDVATSSSPQTRETARLAAFDYPIIRDHPTIITASVLSGVSATVRTDVRSIEVG